MVLLGCCLLALAQSGNAQSSGTPYLAGITSDTCLLNGQRLRLKGRHLGDARLYQLVLLVNNQESVLKLEHWDERSITAILPNVESADHGATLVIKNRRGANLASNRLTIRFCAVTAKAPVAAASPPDTVPLQADPVQRPRQVHAAGPGTVLLPDDSAALAGASMENDAVEDGEVIVFSHDIEAAHDLENQVEQHGYSVKRRRVLKHLQLVMNVIRLPEDVPLKQALAVMREIDPQLVFDANHRYQLMGKNAARPDLNQQLVNWKVTVADCGRGMRIGLVDTAVDINHVSLAGARITSRSFLSLGVKAANTRHATAIASLLVGQPEPVTGLNGLLPAAHLYSAGIFRQRANKQVDTTAELIITALDWLHGQKVRVVNLSLAGKANSLLHAAIEQLAGQGQLVAAAAGNAGPNAPPAYPAAWPAVVAVTAVDAKREIYRQANQGQYIELAAPGVDVWAARNDAQGAYYSGTSYAVPYVSAALAALATRYPEWTNVQLRAHLQQRAEDLGTPGYDPVYGHGLLKADGNCGG